MKNVIKKMLTEKSDEFQWLKDIDADLIPGEKYRIKSNNGIYWTNETFLGKEVDKNNHLYYRFSSDLNGVNGNIRRSDESVKNLINKNGIKFYDENWSIRDEVSFSDNFDDIDKGNFAILFDPPVQLDETIHIQKKLFKKGFSFTSKQKGELITNKTTDRPIWFFESLNFDTEEPMYSSMPDDYRDKKKMLVVAEPGEEYNSFKGDEMRLFKTVIHHNAVVINGNKLIKRKIKEGVGDDFDWVREIPFEVDVCSNYDSINVGDTYKVSHMEQFGGGSKDYDGPVEITVLEKNYCNVIHPGNVCRNRTLLVHVNDAEDYEGFPAYWYREFSNESSIEKCSDGNCMFIICGGNFDEHISIISQ